LASSVEVSAARKLGRDCQRVGFFDVLGLRAPERGPVGEPLAPVDNLSRAVAGGVGEREGADPVLLEGDPELCGPVLR